MGKENKEIIKFAKEKLEEAKQKLYVQEIIQESIKEYEKHREVYLKNEWTYEDIGRAMANIMIVKVKPPICAVGSSDSTSENSLHKHFVTVSLPADEEVEDWYTKEFDAVPLQIWGEAPYCTHGDRVEEIKDAVHYFITGNER